MHVYIISASWYRARHTPSVDGVGASCFAEFAASYVQFTRPLPAAWDDLVQTCMHCCLDHIQPSSHATFRTFLVASINKERIPGELPAYDQDRFAGVPCMLCRIRPSLCTRLLRNRVVARQALLSVRQISEHRVDFAQQASRKRCTHASAAARRGTLVTREPMRKQLPQLPIIIETNNVPVSCICHSGAAWCCSQHVVRSCMMVIN